MFNSLSRCSPATQVSSSFVANQSGELDVDPAITLAQNGEVSTTRPLQFSVGDTLTISVMSPAGLGDHAIIPYSIDGYDYSFAVVTRSAIIPSIPQSSSRRRVLDWTPADSHKITFRSSSGLMGRFRDLGYQLPVALPSADLHAIPDPLTSAVYFYNELGWLVDNISLESPPVAAVRFKSTTSDFFIVPCRNEKIYKIDVSRVVQPGTSFNGTAGTAVTEWINELHFETDIPASGTYLSINRNRLELADHHLPRAVATSASKIWIGGRNKIWLCGPSLSIEAAIPYQGQIVGVAALDTPIGYGAVVVSELGRVSYIFRDMLGEVTTRHLYSGSWMGNPIFWNGKIWVADSERQRLISFDPSTDFERQEIVVDGIVPSYLTAVDGGLAIAGHDTNRVRLFDGSSFGSDIVFSDRVTFISSAGGSLIASHYLKNINVLDHVGESRIVPFEFPSLIRGPLGVLSTPPVEIQNLGDEPVIPIVPNGVSWTVDGIRAAPLLHRSRFSICAEVSSSRAFSFPIIIGDCAVDARLEAIDWSAQLRSISFPPKIIKDGGVQHDIIVTPELAGLPVGIDYGAIFKNFVPYFGLDPLQVGDVLTIEIPFGRSVSSTVSSLTIGQNIFYIRCDAVETEVTTTDQQNCLPGLLRQLQHTVVEEGRYIIPVDSQRQVAVEVVLPSNELVSLGASGTPDHPLSSINSGLVSSDPLSTAFAQVVAPGPLDIYVDLLSPTIITGTSLQAHFGAVPIPGSTPPEYTWAALDAPTGFTISASDDLQSWQQIASFSGFSSWQPGQFSHFTFSNTAAARYWRLTTAAGSVALCGWNLLATEILSRFKINGQAATAGPHQLVSGDIISLECGASPFLDDVRVVSVSGPKNIEFSVRTLAYPTIDTLYLTSLVQPSVRQTYTSDALVISGLDGREAILTTASDAVVLIKNAEPPSRAVTVQDGDSVAVRRTIQHLFETTAEIYQQQRDHLTGGTALVRVGSWAVENSAPVESSVVSFSSSAISTDYATIETSTAAAVGAGWSTTIQQAAVANKFDSILQSDSIYFATGWSAGPSEIPHDATAAGWSSIVSSDQTWIAPSAEVISMMKNDGFNYYSSVSFGVQCESVNLPASPAFSTIKNRDLLRDSRVFELLYEPPHAEYAPSSFSWSVLPPSLVAVSTFQYIYTSVNFNNCDSFSLPIVHTLPRIASSPNFSIGTNRVLVWPEVQHHFPIATSFSNVSKFRVQIEWSSVDIKPIVIAAPLPRFNGIDSMQVVRLPADQYILNMAPLLISSGAQVESYPVEHTWTWGDPTDHGAWPTPVEAMSAAVSAGYVDFIIVRVPDSSSWTFRRESSTSRGCEITPPEAVYAVSGLIQGG